METGRPDKVCGVHFFNPAPVMDWWSWCSR